MSGQATDVSVYKFNHTMFRIKDPKVSIPFYEDVLGMEKFKESAGSDFTNFFLAFPNGWPTEGLSAKEKEEAFGKREGVLELCWNHGTESDDSFKGYASGNDEPGRGFGHIAITVDNLEAAVKRFDDLKVKFKKRPEDGRMKSIAFIYDPDGYWIEVLEQNKKVEHK